MRQPQPTHAQIAEQIEKDAEEVAARLARGEERFRTIEGKLDQLLKVVECIPAIQSDLADVKEDAAKTKEIVEAWSTVKNMGRFIKWTGVIATALTATLGAIYVTIRVAAAHILR